MEFCFQIFVGTLDSVLSTEFFSMSTVHFLVKDQATSLALYTKCFLARSLRSAAEQQRVVPRTHSMFGDRAFSSPAPWNSLPIGVR